MIRAGAATTLLLALAAGPPALAQDADALSRAVGAMAAPLATVKAAERLCMSVAPAEAAPSAGAILAWRQRYGIAEAEEEFRWIDFNFPKLGAAIAALDDTSLRAVIDLTKGDPVGWCGRLGDYVATVVPPADGLDALRRMHEVLEEQSDTDYPDDRPAAPATRLYTVAQLTWIGRLAYDSTDPSFGDDLRERAPVELLGALGQVAVIGRVEDDDTIRTWDGERQSKLAVTCFHFVDDATEAKFAAAEGKELVISGTVDDFTDYAGVWLEDCSILPLDAGLSRSTLAQDQDLEMRPPTAAEAMVAAGAGVDRATIETMLFKSTSNMMMDGFGNGYVDRDDAGYILFKDGTAYRYAWEFPPEDLNLSLVKRRQPELWYRWERTGDGYTLIAADGTRTSLEDFEQVRPFPEGATLSVSYEDLRVGPGWNRRQTLTFKPDGSFAYASDGMIAMQGPPIAGGDIGVSAGGTVFTGGDMGSMVSSALDGDNYTGRYRLEGDVLTLSVDGEERRYVIGLLGDDAARPPPDYLYLRGFLWWVPDED